MAVLDASAVIALLAGEPGSDQVIPFVDGGRISAVNYAEVLASMERAGLPIHDTAAIVGSLWIEVLPFTADHARSAAQLTQVTAPSGLSLGDRACLAVAMDLDEPAITADRAWSDLGLDADVVVVR